MSSSFYQRVDQILTDIEQAGMHKHERLIASPQGAEITLANGHKCLNFCANNYIGLANHPDLVAAAKNAISEHGYGMSSVRFICGTQDIHRDLEVRIAKYLHMEDSILFPSCFDANTGLFEVILTAEDAIVSDQLNHASIIDGVRLCKAKRYRYANNNMGALREQCEQARKDGARTICIVSDGVFSMDGIIANLKGICDIAEEFDAITVVDDSHATGFIGEKGRGTPAFCGVEGRIDILTGTLGKALGGASGGYVAARKNIVDLLKQRARPYLFSNAVAPMIAATSKVAIDLAEQADDARAQLQANQARFRKGMEEAGFELVPGEHPIIPVMFYEETIASNMAKELMNEGIYVTPFTYPVVPKGTARIRTQLSSIHTFEHIDKTIDAFKRVKAKLEVPA